MSAVQLCDDLVLEAFCFVPSLKISLTVVQCDEWKAVAFLLSLFLFVIVVQSSSAPKAQQHQLTSME